MKTRPRIRHLSHDFFEQIVERDDACRATELVEHNGQLHAFAVQRGQHGIEGERFRHSRGLTR